MVVLQSNGLLRYHTVEGPLGEDNMLYGTMIGRPVKYWPHYTATIRENKTGQRWAVDFVDRRQWRLSLHHEA